MNNAQKQPSPATPVHESAPVPKPADDAVTNPAAATSARQMPPSCRNPSEPDQAHPGQPKATESSPPESESVRCSPAQSMTAAVPCPNPASQTPEASELKHPPHEEPPVQPPPALQQPTPQSPNQQPPAQQLPHQQPPAQQPPPAAPPGVLSPQAPHPPLLAQIPPAQIPLPGRLPKLPAPLPVVLRVPESSAAANLPVSIKPAPLNHQNPHPPHSTVSRWSSPTGRLTRTTKNSGPKLISPRRSATTRPITISAPPTRLPRTRLTTTWSRIRTSLRTTLRPLATPVCSLLRTRLGCPLRSAGILLLRSLPDRTLRSALRTLPGRTLMSALRTLPDRALRSALRSLPT